jgi:pyrroline-5-carboxylate reductase
VTARQPGLAPGTTLGVAGAGSMGGAILRGLLASGVSPAQLWATTKTDASAREVEGELAVNTQTSPAALAASADIVLLGVKPAQIEAVADELKSAGLRTDALVISVAAGVTTARIEARFGRPQPVVRAMPNTPALVGQGMTALAAGAHADAEHLAVATRLFSAVGRCITVEERYLDAVTAISGSGPAYIYLVIEALADAGVRIGLPRETAMTLVTQTVLGAATMVQSTNRHPAELRGDVTTPAGCTIAALMKLEEGSVRATFAQAVEAAFGVLRG